VFAFLGGMERHAYAQHLQTGCIRSPEKVRLKASRSLERPEPPNTISVINEDENAEALRQKLGAKNIFGGRHS